MRSSAFTKKVPAKGNINVRYSKCDEIAQTNIAAEIKNMTQNIPVFFFCRSMNAVLLDYFYEIRSITSKSHRFP